MPGTSFPGVEGEDGADVGDGVPDGGAGEVAVDAPGSPEEAPVVVGPHEAVSAVRAVTATRAAA
jgi:hypothetical protein